MEITPNIDKYRVSNYFYIENDIIETLTGKSDLIHLHPEVLEYDNMVIDAISDIIDLSPDLYSDKIANPLGLTIRYGDASIPTSDPEIIINSGKSIKLGEIQSTSIDIIGPSSGNDVLTISGANPQMSWSGRHYLNIHTMSHVTINSIPELPIGRIYLNNSQAMTIDLDLHSVSFPLTINEVHIPVDVTGTEFSSVSSVKFKKNISKFSMKVKEVLDTVTTASYSYINESQKRIGLIADNLHKIISGESQDHVDVNNAIMCAVLAIQEIADLQDKILQEAK
jgi:hypothetical protein